MHQEFQKSLLLLPRTSDRVKIVSGTFYIDNRKVRTTTYHPQSNDER